MPQIPKHDEVETAIRAHTGWVHACARRRVGDDDMAGDVTQAVFILFWRKRGRLGEEVKLTGWLYRAVRYCATNALRLKQIRMRRELEAAMMGQKDRPSGEANWSEVSPELEQAMDRLRESERAAILLRFYRQMSFAEVAQSLGIGEAAAQKRVERALEKLRGMLGSKSVGVGAASLGAMLAENATAAAPAGMVERVVGVTAGISAGPASLIAQGASKMMASATMKLAAVWVVVGLLLAGAGALLLAEDGKPPQKAPGSASMASQTPATSPAGERILSFPAGVVLGTLFVRDDRTYDFPDEGWEHLASAAGQVRIPQGKQVELRVSQAGIGQLAGVAALPADSIHRVLLYSTDADDAAIAALAPLKQLKSLSLRQTRITDAVASTLATLTSLEELGLENTAAGTQCLASIGSSLANLRYLDLWGTKITDADMRQLGDMKNLQTLVLGYTQVGDDGVILSGRFPNLRKLTLARTRVTDRAVGQIAKVTTLEMLDLESTAITDAGIAIMADLPRLKELRIGQTQITDAAMADIATIGTLEKLQLPEGITNVGLACLADHTSLKQIDGIAKMDDESLAVLARIPALEAVELRGPGITDAGMEQVAKMHLLQRLALYDCAVTDEGFAKLGSLSSLQELRLSGTSMSPQGLVALSNFKSLRWLVLGDHRLVHGGLKHATGLTTLRTLCLQGDALSLDDTVLADVGQLSTLEAVIVQDYAKAKSGISDEGVSHLAKLTKLKQLLLDTPGELTDRSLVALSRLRGLRALRLHGNFSDEGLGAMAGMPELYSLLLSGNFSEGAKASVLERTPSLQRIILEH